MENVYNDEPYPLLIDDTFPTFGLSNQAFLLDEGIFTCSFTRIIKSDQYVDTFFDLNKPFYALLAKGPLNAAGKFCFHLLFFKFKMRNCNFLMDVRSRYRKNGTQHRKKIYEFF